MTVYKNMAFGLRLRHVAKAEIDARVREAAQTLGLEGLLQRRPKELSGGQRQRVAVGRAIVRQPAAFLFDEPLSNLDAKLRVEMRAELKKLHRRLATTMIYVTHDQVEAMTLADRVVVMNRGRIQQVDTPLGVYDSPANLFVAGFLGTPSMNLLKGHLARGPAGLEFVTAGSGLALRLPAELAARAAPWAGQAMTLGVRPENVGHLAAGPFAGEGNSLPLVVRVVEPLGDEQVVYLEERAGSGASLVAKLESHVRVKVDEAFVAHLDMARVHLFDDKSGRNVTASQGVGTGEREVLSGRP